MFGRINALIFGIIIGCGLTYGAQRYHVVRAQDGIEVVPKMTQTFDDTYVDVRNFTVTDWANHKLLAAALATNNKSNVIGEQNLEVLQTKVGNVIAALKN